MSDPNDRASLFEPPENLDTEERKRSNCLPIALGVSAVLLVLVLIAGGLFFAGLGLVQTRQSNIPGLLPANTQVYGSITPALSDLPNIARLQAAYPQAFVEENPEAADEQLADVGISFAEDIQPWLGAEASFAIWNADNVDELTTALESEDPQEVVEVVDIAIMIAASNPTAAEEFLIKLANNLEDGGATIDESVYNEVTIYTVTESEQIPDSSFAVARNMVIFADEVASIEGIIDQEEGAENTLVNNPAYQRLRAAQPEDAIGFVFIDAAPIVEAMQTNAEAGIDEALSPEQSERMLEQIDNLAFLEAIGLSISLAGEGVAFDATITGERAALTADADAILTEISEPVDRARLESISRDAFGVMTFRIPTSFTDQILEGFNAEPGGDVAIQQFEEDTGINLERDLLSWLSGDFSIVLLPGETVADFEIPLTLYFALNTPDRDAAQTGMDKLADLLVETSGGQVEFQTAPVGNVEWQAITDISDPESDTPIAGYGFVGEDLVIALGNTAIEGATNGSQNPITDTPAMIATLGNLPDPNGGVLFFDTHKTYDVFAAFGGLLGGFLPSEDPLQEPPGGEGGLPPELNPIQGVGMAGTPGVSEEGIARGRLFLYIAPVEGPATDDAEGPDGSDSPDDASSDPESEAPAEEPALEENEEE